VIIAALNDRAFVILKKDDDEEETSNKNSSSKLIELMNASTDKNEQDGKDDGDATAKKEEGDDNNDGKKEDGKSKNKQTKKKQQQKGKKHNHQENTTNPLEIQAVCCSTQIIDSCIWLAVSRENKTLSLYSIPSSSSSSSATATEEQSKIYPTITYNLPKRARCLAFSTVSSSSSSSSEKKKCHVIIAGDLSGDAIAFPVPSAGAAATATNRRLLLGHTASILTGLNVVPTTSAWNTFTTTTQSTTSTSKPQQQQLILTADRDEKVRISYFPETHIIHGYLLGHSSFISTMYATSLSTASSATEKDGTTDAGNNASTSSNRALCITGSGDGTVRLWDYQSCKEVGMVPVVIKKREDEKVGNDDDDDEAMGEAKQDNAMEEEEEDEKEPKDEGNEEEEDPNDEFSDDDEEPNYDQHTVAVPISVSLSPANAQQQQHNVIVARDGIHSVDIHPIPSPPSKSSSTTSSLLLSHLVSLHKKKTLPCPSQPLAVRGLSDGSIVVLTREPDYLLHFQQCTTTTANDDTTEFENVSSTSSLSTALREGLKDQSIVMPTTTMEKDHEGEWKLQKNKVNDNAAANNQEEQETTTTTTTGEGEGGDSKQPGNKNLHWNDAGRRETARLAEQRRRKRRREGGAANAKDDDEEKEEEKEKNGGKEEEQS